MFSNGLLHASCGKHLHTICNESESKASLHRGVMRVQHDHLSIETKSESEFSAAIVDQFFHAKHDPSPPNLLNGEPYVTLVARESAAIARTQKIWDLTFTVRELANDMHHAMITSRCHKRVSMGKFPHRGHLSMWKLERTVNYMIFVLRTPRLFEQYATCRSLKGLAKMGNMDFFSSRRPTWGTKSQIECLIHIQNLTAGLYVPKMTLLCQVRTKRRPFCLFPRVLDMMPRHNDLVEILGDEPHLGCEAPYVKAMRTLFGPGKK